MSRELLELAAEAVGYVAEREDTDSDLLLVVNLRLAA